MLLIHIKGGVRIGAGILASFVMAGCSKGGPADAAPPPTVPVSKPTSLKVISGDGQVGLAGRNLSQPLIVQLVDASDNGFANTWVHFASSSGTIAPDSVRTDARGQAQFVWTLPVVVGTYSATANVSAISPIAFTASVSTQSAAQVTQSVGAGGGTLTVPMSNGVTELTVPAGILSSGSNVELAIHPIASGQLPNGVQPVTPLVTVLGPYVESDSMISIRIPVTPAEGTIPYEINASDGSLVPVLVLATDANSITVGLRSLSLTSAAATRLGTSSIRLMTQRKYVVIKQLSISGDLLDTGFRPGVDDWEFPNLGSVLTPGGNCFGQTASMAWYYSERKNSNGTARSLFNAFSRLPFSEGFELDNRLGWRLSAVVQLDLGVSLSNVESKFAILPGSDERSWNGIVDAMKLTGRPITVAVWGGIGAGHALLVWKLDQSTGDMWIADPNHPADLSRKIKYNTQTRRFDPYVGTQISGEPDRTYSRIRFHPIDQVDWNRIGARWAEFDNGTIGATSGRSFPFVPITQGLSPQILVHTSTIATTLNSVALSTPSGYVSLLFDGSGKLLGNSGQSPLAVTAQTAGTRKYAIAIFSASSNPRPVDYLDFSVTFNFAPTIAAVVPSSGPLAGGTNVSINGTNLSGMTSATIGGIPLANLVVVSSNSLTGTTPASTTAGAKNVIVTSSLGSSAPCIGCFTYSSPAPTITVVPASATFNAVVGASAPSAQVVSVTGNGGALAGLSRTVTYAPGETAGWLATATLASTTAPTTLTVQPSTTSLTPGTYRATVSISASGIVADSPLPFSVTYVVEPPTTVGLGFGFGPEQFALIPAGTFQMGSTAGDASESPVHTVTITRPFLMQRTEVTWAQYNSVIGTTTPEFSPANTCTDNDCPAGYVDPAEFLQRLNALDPGKNYRLPTEAEWEYAARAGATGEIGGAGVLSQMAWFVGNSNQQKHRVASKPPNAWGLFDMLGNVNEWVSDWFGSYTSSPKIDPVGPVTGTERVWRGGSYEGVPADVRFAARFKYGWQVGDTIGIRLVRSP